LALLGRLSSVRVGSLVMQASEKPAHNRPVALARQISMKRRYECLLGTSRAIFS
jgi:hypothetical protein